MPSPPSFRRFLLLFLRAGNLTFGGGDPTMAVLQQELVAGRRWIAPERFTVIYGLARVTPGTNILAFCCGIGRELFRWRGAIAAIAAVSAPCAFVVVWFTIGYDLWKSNPWARAAIEATLAAAAGMMIGGAIRFIMPHFRRPPKQVARLIRAVVVTALSIWLSAGLKLSPIQIIALAVAAGLIWRIDS